MTKVTLHYNLTRPLAADEFANVAVLPSTYGIARVDVAPTLDKITVDYDASRLSAKDVEAILARHNLPVSNHIPA